MSIRLQQSAAGSSCWSRPPHSNHRRTRFDALDVGASAIPDCRRRWRRQQRGCGAAPLVGETTRNVIAAAVAPAVVAATAASASAAVRTPEEKAAFCRPPGWVAPGPPPVGPLQGPGGSPDPDLAPRQGETLSYLAGDWRIFSLVRGHRWSIDDHLTAVVALEEAARLGRPVRRALDLGCGIGSVLQLLAWGLPPDASLVGVEAQDISVALARRSLRYNLGQDCLYCDRQQQQQQQQQGGQDRERERERRRPRVVLVHGDLRDPLPAGVAPPGGLFDLVTGTPPYVPLGNGGASERPQKAGCNLETRGGAEAYVEAAARSLAPRGVACLCMGANPGVMGGVGADRVRDAAAQHGLVVSRCVSVIPREGKPALFNVYVLKKEDDDVDAAAAAAAAATEEERFVVRLADGRLSPEMHAARAAIGMPPARELQHR